MSISSLLAETVVVMTFKSYWSAVGLEIILGIERKIGLQTLLGPEVPVMAKPNSNFYINWRVACLQ